MKAARLRWLALVAALVALVTLASAALAEDTLKLAIGQRGNWENAAPELGQKAGFFKKRGLTLEILYTQGAGETLQAVISGSADKLAPLQLIEWPRGIAWRTGNDQA